MTWNRFRPGQNTTGDHSPQRPPDRRFGWYRAYNDHPTHPKWRVVARMASVPTGHVVAVVDCLFVRANTNKPRGSLVGFSAFECAAALDFEIDAVARVYAALEEIGWIDQEQIVTWDERQPDREDPTNAVRQARYKERKRAERVVRADRRDARNPQPEGPVTPLPALPVTVVTPRLDSDLESSSCAAVEKTDADAAARSWLFGKVDEIADGEKIVTIRMAIARHHAQTLLMRWLRDIGQDAPALVKIVEGADRQALNETHFENVIVQAIRELNHERWAGPKLPFPMKAVKGGAA